MKNIILYGDDTWFSLLPMTLTRPIGELRVGILTLKEKWALYLNGTVSYITQDYLSEKYPITIEQDNFLINSSYLPTDSLIQLVLQLKMQEALLDNDTLVAARLSDSSINSLGDDQSLFKHIKGIDISKIPSIDLTIINKPYHIFQYNNQEISRDFQLLTKGRESASLSSTNQVFGKYPLFAEEDAIAECSSFNTNDGPIYLGKNSQVMEGSMIRGSFALSEGSIIKMGSKIYGSTTVGPYSKVGGEVQNVVFYGNCNKGHDGYLGNSVIGEWCNLGAGTNSSNLKNNYLPVKIWSYVNESFEDTGLQFCGLIMGDHSKSGINTMFNTGTVVGVASNIFGHGFPRTYIPSFSWGGAAGFTTHSIAKAIETAEIVMARRNQSLTSNDRNILEHIFNDISKTK